MTRVRPGGPFATDAEGELVNEFEPSEQTIRKWINQSESDEGIRSDSLTSTDPVERQDEPGRCFCGGMC